MAFRESISKRLLIFRRVSPCIPSSLKSLSPPNAAKSNFHREYLTSPESRNKCFSIRRFFHRQSDSMLPDFLTLPLREKLRESLKGISIVGDRIRIDELSPPAPVRVVRSENFGVSVEDARKLMRIAQIEKLKLTLKDIPESSISHAKFVQICVRECENDDQGREMAKMLDQSGNVIVLGNTVFLRPQQVAESMGKVISQSLVSYQNDHRRREKLHSMEKQKALIDKKARALVRVELYCGLGFFVAQVVGAARLTFWELSWDVMEPICFFVTSLHFGMGYLFFLKTSTEPTFEGLYKRRFQAKQKKLFKLHAFDVDKYNELVQLFNSKSITGLGNPSPNSYDSSFKPVHC